MSGKLALGIYNGTEQRLKQYAIQSQARCVLLFEYTLGWAAEIKQNANIEIIGRKWRSEENQSQQIGNGPEINRELGRQWAESLCAGDPSVDVWIGLNEVCAIGTADYFGRLEGQVQYELGFADGCLNYGKKACVLNLAPGNYPTNHPSDTQRDKWARFAQTIAPLLSHPGVKYHGIHLYGQGSTSLLSVDPEWYMLRYRLLWDGLQAAGIYSPPFLATEIGHANGWKWLSEEAAVNDFGWWLQEANKDDCLFAGVIFASYGGYEHGVFEGYDTWNIEPQLMALNAQYPVEEQGGDMWTQNEVWDAVCKAAGAPGYNESNAFAPWIESHPEIDTGIFTSDVLGYDRTDWPYLIQPTTTGCLFYRKLDSAISFAKTRDAVPLT